MQNDTPIRMLVESTQFRKQLTTYFGCELTQPLQFEKFDIGFSKLVWKITSPELPRPFLVKEIRFVDELTPQDTTHSNIQLTPDQGFYELETIRAIQKIPALSDRFPRNMGVFAAVHPVHDNYTNDVIEKGGVVRIERAKKLIHDDQRGVSLFIAEEMVKGRTPTDAEVERAQQMRAEGIKTHPRVWLTVDVAHEDFFVKDDGSFVFFDLGNFKDLTPDENRMLAKLTAQDKGKK